jgi:nicotinamidase-related amidase
MKETALLLIDFINDIIHPKGAISSCAQYVQEFQLIKKVNHAIKLARDDNMPILFVIVGFSANYRELLKHSPLFTGLAEKEALKLGTWGCKIHDGIDCLEKDSYLIKHSVSPFLGTQLDLILRRQGIKKIVVGGVSTDMAIQSAVREGHDLGYQIILCEDICGARTREVHLQSLEMLKRLSKISKLDDLSNESPKER